jgi:hypothetical protein
LSTHPPPLKGGSASPEWWVNITGIHNSGRGSPNSIAISIVVTISP